MGEMWLLQEILVFGGYFLLGILFYCFILFLLAFLSGLSKGE